MIQPVALMSSVHSPDDIRIFRKEGCSLANAGYHVSFIVPRRAENVSILPLKVVYVNRANSRMARMTQTAFQVFWTAYRSKARVCHFHDPELMPYGVLLKLAGRKVIYDVHEDLPRQILSKHYISPRLRHLVSATVGLLERTCAMFYDAIIAATPSIAENFPPRKTVLVQNFPLSGELFSDQNTDYKHRGHTFAYVGGISVIRGAKEMIAAFGEVPSDLNATLEIAGKFDPPALKAELEFSAGWKKIVHLGWLSRPETAALLGRSRAGLLLFHPEPNHVSAQPNKLFEYMSAGLPVITSNFPLWKQIIDRIGCGITVDPLKPKEIAAAIEFILTNEDEAQKMGERGKRAVEQELNWNGESHKLIALYKSLFSKCS
jgi:glycosyltransferase involved in cell wall biosynthesis